MEDYRGRGGMSVVLPTVKTLVDRSEKSSSSVGIVVRLTAKVAKAIF
jgi:hypothetical protein